MDDFRSSGVEVKFDGQLAYMPDTGGPGTVHLDADASIGALMHEYEHFLEAREAGHPSFASSYENPAAFIRSEMRGYQREIDMARQTGNYDLVRAIQEQMRERVNHLRRGGE